MRKSISVPRRNPSDKTAALSSVMSYKYIVAGQQLFALAKAPVRPALFQICVPGAHLSISLDNGKVVISWTGTGHLQCATAVTGPWSDVAGAMNPHTAPAAGAHKFYRVVCP